MNSDEKNIKQKIALENMRFLVSNNISLYGKRVLDVGFGLGFNSKMMRELNGDVYGVEPNKDAYNFAINNDMISKNKAFNCSLQELPDKLIGTFDIVTLFLYNINFSERQEVAHMLSKVIKDNGIVIIGLNDEIFIRGDAFLTPVSETIRPFFEKMKVHNFRDNIANRCYIIATQPSKKLEVSRRAK